ncbi:MAG: hypothetical protein MJ061_00870 [Mailhella sp.]|nr:hypothetical protein [Mailhella sp.]
MVFIRKELLSAVTMTATTLFFMLGAREIEGEAAILPQILIWVMIGINVFQYALAIFRWQNDYDVFCLLLRYPFRLVGVQFLISIAYVLCLLPLGFYLSSFLYLLLGSLAANPDPLTPRIIAIRTAGSFAFVFALWALFSYGLGVVIPSFSLF